MLTIEKAREIRREKTKLDYLRLKKAKGNLLCTKELATLMELSIKFWERQPMTNSIELRNELRANETNASITI